MREILFRAKDNGVLNGIWQYGSLDTSNPDAPEIVRIDRHNNKMRIPILIETVGQYTGLTDKNGKNIFEDDIVNIRIGDLKKRGWVFYGNRAARWGVVLQDSTENYSFLQQPLVSMYDITVIGNIYDNPELLGGE